MSLSPTQFAEIESASAPAFSRDGATLFHLRGSGLSQIWALDLVSGATRQLTFHDEKVAFLRRDPTSDRIAYGIDRGGDERQQLMLLDPATGETRALTERLDAIHDWGGWAPDGTRIAMAANLRDEAHFDVWIQQLDTGARECIVEGTGIVTVTGFRPDGGMLAALHDRGYGDMSLLLIDLVARTAREFPQPAGTNYQSVRWTSDGQALMALTDHGGNDMPRLCRLDTATGAVDVVYAAEGREVEAWALSPDGTQLATLENDRGYSVLRLGPVGGDRPVVEGLAPGVVTDLAFSPDGTTLAFALSTAIAPGRIMLLRDGAISTAWAPADPPAAAEWTLVEWESFDGRMIPGWLVLPPGPTPRGGHKAIIWVHGGPVGQSRPLFRPDIQMLVSQGYAVLLPNVRGSSGYGRAYAESDDHHLRPDCVADLRHGRDWLAAHPAIDPQRIGIMGQSYGGYMVNAAITEHPDLWKAAVNYYGIVDFVTTLEGTGPWRKSHRAAEYGDPDTQADLFRQISPIHRIDAVRVPVLAAHGTRDPRVPIGESEQLVQALRERQRTVTYLTFDYAGHGFVRPDDKRRIYAAVAGFFAQHI